MDVPINWVAIALSSVAILALGFIWYHDKVFGSIWRRSAGLKKPGTRSEMMRPMIVLALWAAGLTFVLSNLAYYAHLYFANESWLETVLSIGLWVGLAFTFMTLVMQQSFERRSVGSILVSAGYGLVSVMIAALIVGTVGTPEAFETASTLPDLLL